MKKLLIPLMIIFILAPIEKAYSLFGVGVYGLKDPQVSIGEYSKGDLLTDYYTFSRGGVDEIRGFGAFLYIDVIPVIDLEANIETAFDKYSFKFENAASTKHLESDFGWARVSGYLTVRKKLFGLGVPILGGLKLHAGGGLNYHSSTPLASVDMVQSLITGGLIGEFDSDNLEDELIEYLKENKIDSNGYHVQLGAQIKLLTFNLFCNYRVTFAEDVIPDEDSFSSLWLGLAFGF